MTVGENQKNYCITNLWVAFDIRYLSELVSNLLNSACFSNFIIVFHMKLNKFKDLDQTSITLTVPGAIL